jgi:alpha-L-fucosidase
MNWKFIILLFALLQFVYFANAQKNTNTETLEQKEVRLNWWKNDRFGMFIHWGLYASPARHEWVKNIEHITNDGYLKYFDIFSPDHYDTQKWALQAKAVVPHDVSGLADLIGGREKTIDDLNDFFNNVPENMMWNNKW